MQPGPKVPVLHAAPSAAGMVQVPPRSAEQVPLALQAVYMVPDKSVPQVPVVDPRVSRIQRPLTALQPTPLPMSHCSWIVQVAPT